MSIPRYRIHPKVRALWRDRDVTLVALAEKSGVKVPRALRAISGHPDGLPADRTALAPFLTPEERAVLGWTEMGKLLVVEQSAA